MMGAPVTPLVALSLVAAGVYLAIAVLSVTRGAASPLARPLGLLGGGFFAYHSLDGLSDLMRAPLLLGVAYAVAPLLVIPTASLLLGYAGQRRRHALFLRGLTAYGVALAVLSLWPLMSAGAPFESGGVTWAFLLLVAVVPTFGLVLLRLVEHTRTSEGAERAKSRLLVGALVLGIGSVVFDLAAIAGTHLPRLSTFGLLSAALLTAAVVLDARALRTPGVATFATAAVVAAAAVVVQMAVYRIAEPRSAALWLGTIAVAVAAIASLRPLARDLVRAKARQTELATVGRYTEQMAHDLRNPLAAIRGAAELLQESRRRNEPLETEREMLDLIVERTRRIEGVLETYQRLGRVEPRAELVSLNDLVSAIVAGERASVSSGVRVESDLAPDLPPLWVDPILLTHAVENLIRNARQALDGPGTVTVRTWRDAAGRSCIEVEDDGRGMDARTRERAFDAFFTTRAEGTGLGLALAARVAQAHGGDAAIDSQPGRGARVTLRLLGAPRPDVA